MGGSVIHVAVKNSMYAGNVHHLLHARALYTLVHVCRQGNEDIACQVSISPIAEAAAQWRNDAQVTTHDHCLLCSIPVY